MTFEEIIKAIGKKPYYQDSAVCIFHADCRDVLPLISEKSIDLVLTDPPYGIGYDRNKKHKYTVKNNTVFGDNEPFNPLPLLRFKNLILWGANCYASRLPDSKTWLGWHKTFTNNDKGQTADFELAWSNCIGRSRLFTYLWSGCYRQGEADEYFHPTQKPKALIDWCLNLVPKAILILDPFLGSGTTAYCAKKLGRKCIGIEIEERYAEIAARRCSQTVLNLEILPEKPKISGLSLDLNEYSQWITPGGKVL